MGLCIWSFKILSKMVKQKRPTSLLRESPGGHHSGIAFLSGTSPDCHLFNFIPLNCTTKYSLDSLRKSILNNREIRYIVAVVSIETVHCVWRRRHPNSQAWESLLRTDRLSTGRHFKSHHTWRRQHLNRQVCESLRSGDRLSIGHHFKSHHV